MEDVPPVLGTVIERDGLGPAGMRAFDPEDFVLPGVRFRDVVDYIGRLKAQGKGFFISRDTDELMRLLPAAVFVQLAAWNPDDIFIPLRPRYLVARFPGLAEDDVREACLQFGATRLAFPGLEFMAREVRREKVRALRSAGVSTLDIARHFRLTARSVRNIAPSGKKAPAAGSSKRQRHSPKSKRQARTRNG